MWFQFALRTSVEGLVSSGVNPPRPWQRARLCFLLRAHLPCAATRPTLRPDGDGHEMRCDYKAAQILLFRIQAAG